MHCLNPHGQQHATPNHHIHGALQGSTRAAGHNHAPYTHRQRMNTTSICPARQGVPLTSPRKHAAFRRVHMARALDLGDKMGGANSPRFDRFEPFVGSSLSRPRFIGSQCTPSQGPRGAGASTTRTGADPPLTEFEILRNLRGGSVLYLHQR